ncbi:MAG: hypothetical protein U9Q90_10280 [Campylobacterota bacterium]|nr:hypothetical protein [Campylobacterota bacterium]
MVRAAKLLLSIIMLGIISGCSTTNLTYKNQQLTLQLDGQYLQVHGTSLNRHLDNFGNLYLTREILRMDDGSILVYENALTDDMFEFNLMPLQTIRIVFDARQVITIYYKDSFYLLQLILQDGRVLNVAAEQQDDQNLKLLYGMSTSRFENIMRQLGVAEVRNPIIKRVITIHQPKDAILSRWSVKKVQFVPLITPLRMLFGL